MTLEETLKEVREAWMKGDAPFTLEETLAGELAQTRAEVERLQSLVTFYQKLMPLWTPERIEQTKALMRLSPDT